MTCESLLPELLPEHQLSPYSQLDLELELLPLQLMLDQMQIYIPNIPLRHFQLNIFPLLQHS